MTDWLIQSTWTFSLLVGFLLLLNPIIRRVLNAQVAYSLWLIPLFTLLVWQKPERPQLVMEAVGLPEGGLLLRIVDASTQWVIPSSWHVEWIWLAGCVTFLVIRIVIWFRLNNLLNLHSESFQSNFLALVEQQKRNIEVKSFSLPGAPFVTGLFKPCIYLPTDFDKKYSAEQQKWILVHELAHISRKDLWAQALAELIRICFWFNPLVHIAWSSFREDQELACDFQTLKNSSSRERKQYGSALLKSMGHHLLPSTLAFFTSRKERFIMLQKHHHSSFKTLIGISLSFFIAFITLTQSPAGQAKNEVNKINLSVKDKPLSSFVALVSRYVGYSVSGVELDPSARVTVHLQDVPWDQALRFVLNCSGYDFDVKDEFVHINKKDLNRDDLRECDSLFEKHEEQLQNKS